MLKNKFATFEYIKKKVGGLPPDMQGTSKRPASSYLFTINPESQQLDEEQWQMFYHLVTTLLRVHERISKQ